MKVSAVVSMLHEDAQRNSAKRLFRSRPVLSWTLDRLARAQSISTVTVVCWEDQASAVRLIVTGRDVHVLCPGVRQSLPHMDAVTAARRWCDGWRGSLLGACAFDLGFWALPVEQVVSEFGTDAVMLIDPAAGLIDPALLDALAGHAAADERAEMVFSQAAPGVSGVLLRRELIGKLAKHNLHPGRPLSYLPDAPSRDPIATPMCAPVPTPVARTTYRFTLDSDRQIRRLEHATASLNGQLISTGAEQLVARSAGSEVCDTHPREVVLELTTRRSTAPTWWLGRHLDIRRPDLDVQIAQRLFSELARVDDLRLTLGGTGDPLLHPQFGQIISTARAAGIIAINVETDLHEVRDPAALDAADVVSFHLPAISPAVYEQVMGVDGLAKVLANFRMLMDRRKQAGAGTPLPVPLFVKCTANIAEMEQWYDQWLRALGGAVILGPSNCAGQIPDVALADMSPPLRKACRRISSRMTILSDGRVASCEEDVLGLQTLGHISQHDLATIWTDELQKLRAAHSAGQWQQHPLCARCREWHRP